MWICTYCLMYLLSPFLATYLVASPTVSSFHCKIACIICPAKQGDPYLSPSTKKRKSLSLWACKTKTLRYILLAGSSFSFFNPPTCSDNHSSQFFTTIRVRRDVATLPSHQLLWLFKVAFNLNVSLCNNVVNVL